MKAVMNVKKTLFLVSGLVVLTYLAPVTAQDFPEFEEVVDEAVVEEVFVEDEAPVPNSVGHRTRMIHRRKPHHTQEPTSSSGVLSEREGNERVEAVYNQLMAAANEITNLRKSDDFENLNLGDIARLKKAQEHLERNIEEFKKQYLGLRDYREVEPTSITKIDEPEESADDCEINPGDGQASCNGDQYRLVEEAVVGEVELPSEFEEIIVEVPRHVEDYERELDEGAEGEGHAGIVAIQ